MLPPQTTTTRTILAASAIGFVGVLAFYWYKKKSKYNVPTKWEAVGRVKNLFIYPLKSGHRIELQTAECTEYGIRMPKSGSAYQFYDRNLLIFKEDSRELTTARQHPKMIFIKTLPHPTIGDSFTLDAPEMPTLQMKLPTPKLDNEGEITFHKGEKIHTVDCGEEAAKWISRYVLGSDSGLRLGYHDALYKRNITKSHKNYLPVYPLLRSEAMGMYTDYTSYLVVNQASVEELNDRISKENITALRFRPNILVENAPAYVEDNWNWIKIGDVILYMAKPCTRCIFTTIDPETGIKAASNEPLKTLRTFRLLRDINNVEVDGSLPVMGNNMGLKQGGEVSVGDIVYVGKY